MRAGRRRRVSFAPVEVSITKRINSSDSCYEWSPPNFFLIIHLERETRRRRIKGGEAKAGKVQTGDDENAWKRTFAAVLLLEHTRREFPEERDERPRRGRHGLIPGALILRQILQQVAVHHQRTPDANLPNRVDTHGDNLRSGPVVNELVHQLPEQGFQRVGGNEFVTRRRRGRQKPRHLPLVRLHVPLQKRVQVQQVQPVQSHHARQHLDQQHLRVELERTAVLQTTEEVLREGLRVVDELHCREASLAVVAILAASSLANGRHLALELRLLLRLGATHALVCSRGMWIVHWSARVNGETRGCDGEGGKQKKTKKNERDDARPQRSW